MLNRIVDIQQNIRNLTFKNFIFSEKIIYKKFISGAKILKKELISYDGSQSKR